MFPAPVCCASPHSTNNRVAHAKGLLQVMREETEAMKKDPSRAKPSEVRVRENLQNTLTRKFVDLAKDYQNRQVIGGPRRVLDGLPLRASPFVIRLVPARICFVFGRFACLPSISACQDCHGFPSRLVSSCFRFGSSAVRSDGGSYQCGAGSFEEAFW